VRKQIVALEYDADILSQGPQVDVRQIDPAAADDDLTPVDLLEPVDAA